MKIMFMLATMVAMGTLAYSQGKKEADEIRKVVTTWAQAADRQDAEAAGAQMDDNCRVVMNRLFGQTEVGTMDKNAYLEGLRAKKFGGTCRTLKFKKIHVMGTTATVILEMRSDALEFQSSLQLIQDAQGMWRIVADLPFVTKRV